MLIYLIRHTTPDVRGGVCYGQTDIGLADTYDVEMRKIRGKLRDRKAPEVVYTSPLSRCRQLADDLARCAVVVDDRLAEIAFGDWEMLDWEAIDRAELDSWAANVVQYVPPRGESLEMLHRRVRRYLGHLLSQPHRTVAAVTHAGVIRCFYACLANVPLTGVLEMGVGYGDVFVAETAAARGGASIVRLG